MTFPALQTPGNSYRQKTSSFDAAPFGRSRIDIDALSIGAFFVYLVFNLAVVADRSFGVPGPLALLPLLVVVIPAIRSLLRPGGIIPIGFAQVFSVLWLSSLFLSTATSRTPGASLAATAEFVVEGLILLILVSTALSRSDDVWKAITVFAYACAFLSILTLIQQSTRNFGNEFFGLAQVEYVDGGVGVPDRLGSNPRLAGPVGETNRYAQLLTVAFPMAFFAARRATRPIAKAGGIVATTVIALGATATLSRGATVTLVVLILALTAFRYLKFRLVAPVLVFAVAVAVSISPAIVERVAAIAQATNIDSGSSNIDGALKGRTQSVLSAFDVFTDYPITGVGPNQFFAEFSQQYGNRQNLRYFTGPRRAHNLLLEIAADGGVIALMVFLGLLTATLGGLAVRAWRHRQHNISHSDLAASLMFALLAYIASGTFLHLAFQRYFWALIGVCSAAIATIDRESRRAHPDYSGDIGETDAG